MEEKELELHPLVLQELDVVDPVGIFLTCDFYQGTESFNLDTVANQYETFPHEDLVVFLLAYQGQTADCHEGICQGVVDDQVLDVLGGLSGLHLPLIFFLYCSEKLLAAHLLKVFLSFFKCLNGQDELTYCLLICIEERRFHIVTVETGQIRQIDLCPQDLLEI